MYMKIVAIDAIIGAAIDAVIDAAIDAVISKLY